MYIFHIFLFFTNILYYLNLYVHTVLSKQTQQVTTASTFFKYGSSVGDKVVPQEDDSSSGKIRLKASFHFFDDVYTDLYVMTNGGISFKNEITTFTPKDFPLAARTPLIAPYWADVNTKNGGKIWYRQSTSQRDLDTATAQIRAFQSPKYADFRATWAFIATWDNVAFYGATDEGKKRRCTFQATLAVDASTNASFAIFNYDRLEWTAGAHATSGGE